MLSTDQVQTLIDANGQVVGSDGEKIGKVGQFFLDEKTGEPAWVTVKTGLFGGGESFVPLDDARVDGDDVVVGFDKARVKDAPRIDDENGHLSPSDEDELYRYYGFAGDDAGQTPQDRSAHDDERITGTPTDADKDRRDDDRVETQRAAGHDSSGPDTDTSMTRSEEQLHVGTQTETVGKARLRKYIVTENVTQTVPVSHEEVRVEREPITDANRGDAMSGGELTEEDHEVDLKGERVVVDKDTVPVERVQMGTETVTEDQTVSEQVRKEQIDADQGPATGDGHDAPR